MYYVKIIDDVIVAKGQMNSDIIPNGFIEITKEIFDSLVSLPATFQKDEMGEIINVVPTERPPEPQPQPTLEEQLAEKDTQIQLLKEQQLRTDADLSAFMDFVLMGGM